MIAASAAAMAWTAVGCCCAPAVTLLCCAVLCCAVLSCAVLSPVKCAAATAASGVCAECALAASMGKEFEWLSTELSVCAKASGGN